MRGARRGRIVGATVGRTYGCAAAVTRSRMTTRASRLQRSSDVRSTFEAGSLAHGRSLVVHVRSRVDADPARWTVVAGRKVGSAVERNRAKRRLREAVRAAGLPAGHDVVVVARSQALLTPLPELAGEVRRLVERAIGKEPVA